MLKKKDLIHLDADFVGVYDVQGWYFEDYEDLKQKGLEPVFQCQFGHSGSLREHSISPEGIVKPAVICHCGHYDKEIKLLDWPPGYYKNQDQIILKAL